MATTETKQVRVLSLNKFGFMAEGFPKGLYFSKKFTDQVKVVPGVSFQAELYTSDGGHVYLNKILSMDKAAPAKALVKEVLDNAAAPKVLPDADRAKRFTPKFNKTDDADKMTKADWDKKDVRISRQGCIQAAVHALGPVLGPEQLFAEAVKLADKMLAYVREEK